MNAIEPNVGALCWFALFAAVAGIGFYVIAGAFPLETRDDLTRRWAGIALAGLNAVAFAALAYGALRYGFAELRWTSVVIVAGLAALFAPGIFHLWPERWRDGIAGLAILLGVTAAALAALQTVGGVFAA
jgi:drug/metabolite transporter (DMT)-like permease